MKNRFRFKSLMLALLMTVTPVFGVAGQNPFVINSSALVSVEESKTKGLGEAAQAQNSHQKIDLSDYELEPAQKFTYRLVLKKAFSCLGWSVVGLAGAFTCSAIGGFLSVVIGGLILQSPIVMAGGILAGIVAGKYCAATNVLNSFENIVDLIKALRAEL